MAGITLAQASAQLTVWLAASTAVASGQSYTMGDRSLTLANAVEIRKMVDYWEGKVQTLSRSGFAIKGGTPCG
jgi:hypothetical protein